MLTADEFESKVAKSLRTDRYRLRQLHRRLTNRRKQGKPADKEQRQLDEWLEKSQQFVQQRRDRLPPVSYDPQLPITAKLAEIRQAIENHQVVIVCGETGSGKSTQLPKLCLEMGLAEDAFIGHTQPRRIAARTIATRLAEELARPLGDAVGFKIRFTDETKPTSYIKLMTDGILLAETQGDRFLDQYNVLIIDEAHERSLNIDFLLGYLKRLLPKRPELKLIITSATIDAERFQSHFVIDDVEPPIVEVSGRGYPVEVLYRPFGEDEEDDERDGMEAIGDAVEEVVSMGTGDGLIFFPTEQDIRAAAKSLRGRIQRTPRLAGTEVLPLYARLPTQEQNRIFDSHAQRRLVLATNVAESSLTVPNIRFVIDTGTARISRYSPRSKVQRLPIEAISQASANQRAGRCGRVGPGICVRMYAEDDFANREEYTTPEIRRTNLASVILSAKALQLGEIDQFPFIDPPRPDSIRDGYRTLFELGAIDDKRELTELGRRLARLPVDPRVGRMILAADEMGCLSEMLIIASGLEVQDPRDRPPEKQQAADEAHAKFQNEQSDFLSLLNVWDFYHKLKEELSQSRLRKACQQNFLSYQRMRQWLDIHRQLLRLAKDAKLKPTQRKDDYDSIHQALLTGLLSGVAMKSDRSEYLGAGGNKFFLWPGSGVMASKPDWIIAAELVETSRRFGRIVAKIDPNWIEPLAEHVIKRSYSDPHWHCKSARCMAFEKVLLFGLPVVPKRRIGYGAIDPVISRQLMIERGFVGNEYEGTEDFLVHNRLLVEEINELRAKTRSRDLIIDDATLEQFYDERLPEEIVDARSLRQAIRESAGQLDQTLTMSKTDLLPEKESDSLESTQFPPRVESGSLQLDLDYRFEPGAEDDGVTITVPVEGLAQLNRTHLEWLVPGLFEELVICLIRSLPKRIRRNVTPAPDAASFVSKDVAFGEGELVAQVAASLSRYSGENIPIEEFDIEKRPAHLRMNVRVVDEQGEVVAEGRELGELRDEVGIEQGAAAVIEDEIWNEDALTEWTWGELPREIKLKRGGLELPSFPAVLDKGTSVSLRLLPHLEAAEHASRFGLSRLFAIQFRKDIRSNVNWLPQLDKIRLWASTRLSNDQLTQDVGDLLAFRAVNRDRKLPRDPTSWQEVLDNKVERISFATQELAKLLPDLFESYHRAQIAIEEVNRAKFGETVSDVKRQLSQLITARSLVETPWEWLEQFPRYFQAAQIRLEKVAQLGSKEHEYRQDVAAYWEQYSQASDAFSGSGEYNHALEEFRWMIEEYRVSLFAQQLGTYVSVSPRRLEKQWAKVHRRR